MVLFRILGVIGLLVGLLAIYFQTRVKHDYPRNLVQSLITNNPIIAKSEKLTDIVVLITGSTSGIGETLADELYNIGVTVVVASRNEKKCKATVEAIRGRHPNSKGLIDYGILDVGDLHSVERFVSWFDSKYDHINYLMNNAGTHYAVGEVKKMLTNDTILSPQGYDEVFATNYLGHFLLTELLIPAFKENQEARIISTSSGYHHQSDGSTLVSIDGALPDAANGVQRDFFHKRKAYGVTKLAQILHVYELQRRLPTRGVDYIKTIAYCPGWVNTNMLPHGLIGSTISKLAFDPIASLLAPMAAMFDSNLQGGTFLANYYMPIVHTNWGKNLIKFATKFGFRDSLTDVIAFVLAVVQTNTYGYNIQASSEESYNEELAKNLYDWSYNELAKKGYLYPLNKL